jgi:hypothetical protein
MKTKVKIDVYIKEYNAELEGTGENLCSLFSGCPEFNEKEIDCGLCNYFFGSKKIYTKINYDELRERLENEKM